MTQENRTDDSDSRRLSSANKTPQTLSPSSNVPTPSLLPAAIKAAKFTTALKRLVSSKRALELTPHEVETWLSALEMYSARPSIVHEAIVRMSLSDDPFPDLGKLIAKCEEIRCEQDGIVKNGSVRIGTKQVQQVAKAWGLET